jgi:eukaryotic-like serine/threonine-protein kinase
MGQVYRALDSVMKREVAIKTLHKDLVAAEPQYAERFLNEAIAAGGITHQHVVKIHDYGVHDGQPYIVMEYLQGKSLSAVVLEAPLAIERAVDIVLSACSAVYFCHRQRSSTAISSPATSTSSTRRTATSTTSSSSTSASRRSPPSRI